MSFLDNLENTLKNLENREPVSPEETKRTRERQAQDRERARASQQYIDALRSGNFVNELVESATKLAFAQRMKVRPVWIGETLRLEAREKKLELEPTPEGVLAKAYDAADLSWSEITDTEAAGAGVQLATKWLS
ncbi:MAG TPA: hypothetical protein VE621_00710 [Bryobacteraceae bacterium]|jgi:hypothetical protein|nr:hypothetical protein [Bryobacteraceae bacterium]